jgi:hypothetical protein
MAPQYDNRKNVDKIRLRINQFCVYAAIILISTIIGLIMFEYAGKHIFNIRGPSPFDWKARFMFFSAADHSSVFQNVNDIFTYSKSTTIHAVAYYEVEEGKFAKEYDYFFGTNDLGLIDSGPIGKDAETILVLGASYGEGLGAVPWVSKSSLRITNPQVQLINGSLLGTGFKQWLKVHDYIKKSGIAISKVIVVFTSGNLNKKARSFPKGALLCLEIPKTCNGMESFFGLDETQNMGHLLTAYSNQRQNNSPDAKSRFGRMASSLFPLSYFILDELSKGMLFKVSREDERRKSGNERAIKRLIHLYGDDVIFVHIPEKDEILYGMTDLGAEERAVIRKEGKKVVDGFALCGLTIQDYLPHDEHPNQQGYAKIAACISQQLTNSGFIQ